MKTRKTWEKLLGIFLVAVLVLGMIPVAQLLMRDKDVQSNAGAALAAGSKIYIKPNNGWLQANAVIAVRSNNDQNNYITMTKVAGSDNIYVATLPVDTDSINISRHSGSPASGSNGWNWTDGWMSIESGKNMYTMNASDSVSATPGGSWSTYGGSDVGGNVVNQGLFYVNTDLVDYLNDERVTGNTPSGHSSSNQGQYLGSGDAPFSRFNYVVSSNSSKYTFPLYVGPLYFMWSRYGRDNNGNAVDLTKWNSGANVAPASSSGENLTAAAQGLVYHKLSADGQLLDPVTQNVLPYFNKTAADTWTNGGNKIMQYYQGLQFPFKATYNTATGVTTYSYDSDKDDAVYYDYINSQLYTSSTHVQNQHSNSTNGNGFYPLNKPGDYGNAVNNGFGVKFTVNFTVSDEGIMIDGQPVTFNFTGDDDVWVFIDDYLVLDMGGAHCKAEGTIDFSTLSATVKNAFTATTNNSLGDTCRDGNLYNNKNTWWQSGEDSVQREMVTSGKVTTAFPAELKAKFQNEYATDSAQVHTLTMFYMERGMLDSNMSISFTMSPVPSGLTVSKELNEKEINAGLIETINKAEEFSFNISGKLADNSTPVSFASYALYLTAGAAGEAKAPVVNGNVYTISGIRNDVYAGSFANSQGANAFVGGSTFQIVENTTGLIFDYSSTSWAVYNADKNYALVENYKGTGTTAGFKMGDSNRTAYNYAVTFTNNMKLGNLSVTKVADVELASQTFNFEVLLDLDGTGSAFSSTGYEGLVYTLSDGTTGKTGSNGTFTLKRGQTATFEGIPAGATYIVREIVPQNPNFNVGYAGDTGSIKYNETVTATITNTTKTLENVDKTIYIEADGVNNNYKSAKYTIMYGTKEVKLETVSIPSGLSITWSQGSGEIKVSTADENQAGKSFRVFYTGKIATGEKISGYLNVHTFIATEKTYVFDFGLQSIISDTTANGCGLFQGGAWEITNVNTSAAFGNLIGFTDSRKTEITTTAGSISADGEFSGQITFKPSKIMDKVEGYEYTVRITADGQTFDANNPETGTTLTGYINVLPANTVYYEDEFVFGNTLPGRVQSHDWTTNYGYDDAYNADMVNSNNSVTHLVNNATKSFTFIGTGFDIISVTAGTSGGMRVDVKAEDGTVKTYYVDNMYKNGTLYQVPVISVMGLEHGTYTVTITSLNGYDSVDGDGNVIPTTGGVYIDGIRIYNPLKDMGYTDPTDNYLSSEQNVTFTELRDMFKNNKLSLADKNLATLNAKSVIENYAGTDVKAGTTWADLYKSGPNNELYVPAGNGVKFNFTVSDLDNFTLQIGAKDVKSGATVMRVWVKIGGNYKEVNAMNWIRLSTATDMYYDLTAALKDAGIAEGTSYELVICNGSTSNLLSDFISLTTVKCSSVTLN